MKRMIFSAHGIQRFELTNPVHIPHIDETIFYSDTKFLVIDVVYDYDGQTIYIYGKMQ